MYIYICIYIYEYTYIYIYKYKYIYICILIGNLAEDTADVARVVGVDERERKPEQVLRPHHGLAVQCPPVLLGKQDQRDSISPHLAWRMGAVVAYSGASDLFKHFGCDCEPEQVLRTHHRIAIQRPPVLLAKPSTLHPSVSDHFWRHSDGGNGQGDKTGLGR